MNTNNSRPSYYVTTSIPYVNAEPHLGFALESVQTDVLARYYRQLGHDVRFQTGTDENSLKNVLAAEKAGVSTQDLVAQHSARFHELRSVLDLSFDDFIRTSAEQRHIQGVYQFWQECGENGDIYKKSYRGLYCVGCEDFYTEEALVDGLCPDHGTAPEWVDEENYFFRLSHYQDQLLELIESNRLRIVPETRRNEILSFIRRGLLDFSISRSHQRAKGWGISVPDDPSQVIYVWFDALINYITGPGYADQSAQYQQYWGKGSQRAHVIGKDITRFHAIYWPAMLLSASVPLPDTIYVHGFLTAEGAKISKSTGNVVDPVELVEQFGSDSLRYYLLRKVPATRDSNYTRQEFVQTHNAELADQLGNLLNRVVKMIERYYDGLIPAPGPLQEIDQQLIDTAFETEQIIHAEVPEFGLHKALAAIWQLIAAANKYIVDVEPWTLAKHRQSAEDKVDRDGAEARLSTTLYVLAETLRLVADYLIPFLPQTAHGIAEQIGTEQIRDGEQPPSTVWGQTVAGTRVQSGEVLFPKILND